MGHRQVLKKQMLLAQPWGGPWQGERLLKNVHIRFVAGKDTGRLMPWSSDGIVGRRRHSEPVRNSCSVWVAGHFVLYILNKDLFDVLFSMRRHDGHSSTKLESHF